MSMLRDDWEMAMRKSTELLINNVTMNQFRGFQNQVEMIYIDTLTDKRAFSQEADKEIFLLVLSLFQLMASVVRWFSS